MRRRSRPALAAWVCVLLVLGVGCAENRSDQPAQLPSEAPSAPAEVDAFVAELAAAGIGVYAAGSTTPVVPVTDPGPVTFTADEAAAAAAGVAAPAGLTGADLDQLAVLRPFAAGTAPIPSSLLVGAWSQVAPGPRAAMAKRILGKQDWTKYQQVVFPVAVLTLFAADVAKGGGAPTVNAAQGTSACELFMGAIFGTIDQVFAAIGRFEIKTFTGNVFTDILTFIRNVGALLGNAVLDGARIVLVTGIETALAPILSGVALVATIAAVATKIVTALQPWTATFSNDPLISHRDTEPHPGSLTMTMTSLTGDKDWPEQITGCARSVQVDLPSLKPSGGQLFWSIQYQHPAPMIVKLTQPSTLDKNGKATMTFETLPESPEVAAGELKDGGGVARIYVNVHRTDLDKLHQLLSQEMIKLLPGIAQKAFAPALLEIVDPQLKKLLAPLTTLRDQAVHTDVLVGYHVAEEKAPTPSRKKLVVPTGCPSAAVTSFGYASAGSQVVDGVLSCWYSRGKVLLGVAIVKQKATKSICPQAKPIDIPGAEAAWIDHGSCRTPVIDVVVSNGTLRVTEGDGPDEKTAIAKRILGVE